MNHTVTLDGDPIPTTASRRRRVVGALVLVALTAAVLTGVSATPAGAQTSWQSDMLNQLNNYRAQNGVGPLRLCPTLNDAIQGHTNDMVANGYFAHNSLNGATVVNRVEAAGYTGWTNLGENLASGQTTVESVLNAWINSSGHRANLLNPGFTDVGLGRTNNVWGQDFGAGGRCSTAPIGNYESVSSPWSGIVAVAGWALDRSAMTTPVPIDAYVDGAFAGRFTANTSRPDVGAAFPGAGNNHGFSFQIPTNSGGVKNVCLWALSVTGGINIQLGCRLIGVNNPNPIGAFDTLTVPSPGHFRVTGWTFDPETAAPIDIHVYANGVFMGASTANTSRPDVGAAFPGYGNNHGFDAVFPLNGGYANVCVYAINAFNGINPLLGCKARTIPSGNPLGAFDRATRTGATTATISGWTFDPETASPINVHVYVNNAFAGQFTANTSRPDVGAAFPGYGNNHGFSTQVTVATSASNICVYAINVGVGINPLLGCKLA